MPSLVSSFATARIAVGALSWIAPGFTERIFGLGADGTQPVVTQLFGARDLALGALVATSTGARRTELLRLGLAIDAADALGSARQAQAGTLSPQGLALVGGGAVLFMALGTAALRLEA